MDNLNKSVDDYQGFWSDNPYETGIGWQFRIVSPTTVSRIVTKLRAITEGSTLASGSLIAYIYSSDGSFRSTAAYADALIATSLNSVDIGNLNSSWSEQDFNFDDVELEPGIYFFCLKTSSYVRNDGYLQVAITSGSSSLVGSWTYWDSDGAGGGYWYSEDED